MTLPVNSQSVLTFTVVSTEHTIDIFSEWTTVETALDTDVRHSAGNCGVSEVQQCCTGARVPP